MKRRKKYIFHLIPLLCFLSCTDNYYSGDPNGFYEFSKLDNDVLRLPLIYPFQLESAYFPGKFGIMQNSSIGSAFGLTGFVDSVNVNHNLIFIMGKLDMIEEGYFIFNPRDSTRISFHSYEAISQYCSDSSITLRLYSTKLVYELWRDSGYLPWHK